MFANPKFFLGALLLTIACGKPPQQAAPAMDGDPPSPPEPGAKGAHEATPPPTSRSASAHPAGVDLPCPDTTEAIALLIGVGSYPGSATVREASGVAERGVSWTQLNSAVDLDALTSALSRFGFTPRSSTHFIWRIADEQATADGIHATLEALSECARTTGAGQGGRLAHVFVHYSGHGQQITDDNCDETDGYDEAWVAWGAPMNPVEGYDGSRHVRDDAIGAALRQVRRGIGETGTVVLSSDSCHSGTMSRGAHEVTQLAHRGGKPIGPPQQCDSLPESNDANFGPAGAGLAAAVSLGAARDEQLAWEAYPDFAGISNRNQPMGLYTSRVVAALTSRSRGPVSWTDLYGRLKVEIPTRKPIQSPTFEGADDIGLFGAAAGSIEPFAAIKRIDASADEVILDSGFLAGFAEGSRVAFLPITARNATDGRPVAEGAVIEDSANQSRVRVDASAAVARLQADPEAFRVFITEGAYGDLGLQVAVRGDDTAIHEAIETLPGAHVAASAERAELTVVARQAANSPDNTHVYDLRRSGDRYPFAVGVNLATAVDRIRDALRVELLSVLLATESNASVQASAIELQVQLLDRRGREVQPNPESFQQVNATGELIIEPQDRRFRMSFRNTSRREAYVTLIAYDSDGELAALLPEPGRPHSPIAPGRDYSIGVNSTAHVEGMGTIYIITSPEPAPLGRLFMTAARSRGAPSGGTATDEALRLLHQVSESDQPMFRGLNSSEISLDLDHRKIMISRVPMLAAAD